MERGKQVSMTVHDYELMGDYDSDCESKSREPDEFSRYGNGMVKLEESGGNEEEYRVLKRTFLLGMRSLSNVTKVVAIHKKAYSSVAEQAKMEAFRIHSQAVAARRGGDANLKYAWYGGSRAEICDVVNHGFGRCGYFLEGLSHGIGLCLSPATLPIHSAMRAEEDEEGVRHMLLCRVILGKSETISAGSRQSQPSSMDYDSGIDNPLAPTKYIIWSAHMNTHILPYFKFTFTAPSSSLGRNRNSAKKRSSASLKFGILINALSKLLPPSMMTLVRGCYSDYEENKIGRPVLIRRWRSIVGDELLCSVIKSCRDRESKAR